MVIFHVPKIHIEIVASSLDMPKTFINLFSVSELFLVIFKR